MQAAKNVSRLLDELPKKSRKFWEELFESYCKRVNKRFPPPKGDNPDNRPWLIRQFANIISVIKFGVAFAIMVGLSKNPRFTRRLFWCAMILVYLALDAVDGTLARGLHAVSSFGKAIDPAGDKALVIGLLQALCRRDQANANWCDLALLVVVGWVVPNELLLTKDNVQAGLIAKDPELCLTVEGAIDAGKMKFAIQAGAIIISWLLPARIGKLVAASILVYSIPSQQGSRVHYRQQLKHFRAVRDEVKRCQGLYADPEYCQ